MALMYALSGKSIYFIVDIIQFFSIILCIYIRKNVHLLY